MINFKKSSHWYDCATTEPTAQHDSDLRDARKLGLYPSITSVLKEEFTNPGLDRYKANQLAAAAFRNPRMEHDTIETYAQRIYEASLEHSEEASDFGKEVHSAIEDYPQLPLDETLKPYIEKFGNWYDDNVSSILFREKILVDHDLGLAGTCDFIGVSKKTNKIIMPDWKTQGVKKSPKGKKTPAYYDSWVRQLSFYAVAYAKETGLFPSMLPECSSVVIDSSEADIPFERPWSNVEIAEAYEDVCIAAYRYFKSRNFWPHTNGKPSIKVWAPQPSL